MMFSWYLGAQSTPLHHQPAPLSLRPHVVVATRTRAKSKTRKKSVRTELIDVPNILQTVLHCDHHSVPFIFHGGGCVLRPSVPRLLINFKLQNHDECLTWLISFKFSAFCLYITNLMWDACPYKDNSVLI